MCFINVEDLGFKYKNNIILSNLNFTIHNNDFISLIGPSGSGKSTILKILVKLLTSYTGNIYINSVELKNYKNNFAYMPQNHLLLPWKTILDNLCVPLNIKGKSKKQAIKYISIFLEEFDLTNLLNRYPHEISGGQKQKVALLRSILLQKNFLLLDEPFSQIDSINKVKLHKFLRTIYQKYKYTILLVTHDIDEAILLSNKIYIINKQGTIYQNYHIDLPSNRNELTCVETQFIKLKKKITNDLLVLEN